MIFSEIWRHGPIRRHDADGKLLEAGYRWDQLRLIEKLELGGAGAALLCAAPFMYVGHSPEASVACLLAGLALLSILALLQRWPRVIVFTREGRVRSPHGIVGRFWERDLGALAEVSSIELTSSCRDFGVVLFTTEGRTILLAERMFKADARLVAVQTTKALREIRESIATIAGKRREPKETVWIS